jgi:phage shock protein PspC (stress-responsive transcriptional regulator)
MKPNYWYRSKEGLIAGVCRGIAERFGIETWIVRLVWLLATLYFGIGLMLYFFLVVALPLKGNSEKNKEKMILGVCAKLANRVSWDVGLTRAACMFLGLSSLGTTIVGYIILYFLLEDEPQKKKNGEGEHDIVDLN